MDQSVDDHFTVAKSQSTNTQETSQVHGSRDGSDVYPIYIQVVSYNRKSTYMFLGSRVSESMK